MAAARVLVAGAGAIGASIGREMANRAAARRARAFDRDATLHAGTDGPRVAGIIRSSGIHIRPKGLASLGGSPDDRLAGIRADRLPRRVIASETTPVAVER